MIDRPADSAGLVSREVRTGSRDGATTRVVVARRSYATDQADLWDALTSIERLPRWFLPVRGDLRLGGRFQFEGNAGGVVQECRAPESFTVTWEMGPMTSWLTVTLRPDGEGTELELVHEAPVDPDMWRRFGPGAVGLGWDGALMGLGLHLQTGEPVDPTAALAFPLSSEGGEFFRAAAAAWAAAAIADGDAVDEATGAAEASIAFYTTAPDDDSTAGGG